LTELASKSFEPKQRVFVDAPGLTGPATLNTNDNAAPVEFLRYSPRDVVVKCEQQSAGILLLNDRYDPNWKVHVDGKPEKLLRCNHFMRGVYLEPGKHIVQYRFQPPFRLIYVSVAALGLGVLLSGVAIATAKRGTAKVAPVSSKSSSPRSQPRAAEKRTPQAATRVGK